MAKINFVVTGKYSLGVQGNSCTPNCGYELNVTNATVEAVKAFQENGYLTLHSIDGVPYVVDVAPVVADKPIEPLEVVKDIEVEIPLEVITEVTTSTRSRKNKNDN